jgi:hypothetical protein
MSSLKLIISERGKEFLVLDRFKYRFHKELSSGVKRWVCSISGNKVSGVSRTIIIHHMKKKYLIGMN